MHHRTYCSRFLPGESNLAITVFTCGLKETHQEKRETSKLVSSLKTIMRFCLFVCRLLVDLLCFLLKLFTLQNRLGETGATVSWSVSFRQPRTTLVTLVCSCHPGKASALSATGTSPSPKMDVVVWLPFVIPNHGENYEEER